MSIDYHNTFTFTNAEFEVVRTKDFPERKDNMKSYVCSFLSTCHLYHLFRIGRQQYLLHGPVEMRTFNI